MQLGVVCVCLILDLLTGISGRHLTDPASTCDDVHVWLAGGAVDCKYLYQTSHNGIHSRPAYYCTQYALTDCCHTCTRLGFGPDATTSSSVTTERITAATTHAVVPKQKNYTVIFGNASVRSVIDVALPVRSFPEKITTIRPAVALVNESSIPERKQNSTAMQFIDNSNCTDEGIWMLSGRVACTYLQEASFWGLHLQQTYYCHEYPLTSCCRTCASIDGNQTTVAVKPV